MPQRICHSLFALLAPSSGAGAGAGAALGSLITGAAGAFVFGRVVALQKINK
jgi:hypothetical protein